MAVTKLLIFLAVINIAVCLESTNSSVVKPPKESKYFRPCYEEGFHCKSCRESVYCIQYPDGSFHETLNTECGPNEFCYQGYGVCGQWPQEHCYDFDIEYRCHSPGIFPDPFDCTKYHHCIKYDAEENELEHLESYCIQGWAFNPKTGHCSTKLEDKCPEIVPECIYPMQSGPIKSNPALYYVCMEQEDYKNILYPELFACPYNYVYETNGCVNKYNIGLSSSGLCNAAGSFYHPSDCKKYRVCTQVGATPVEQTCEYAHKFVPGKGCVPFDCDNCSDLF